MSTSKDTHCEIHFTRNGEDGRMDYLIGISMSVVDQIENLFFWPLVCKWDSDAHYRGVRVLT